MTAQAVDWRFQPTLSAYATYTDNVNQSAHNPENSLILGATPGFSLRSQGSRRVQAALQYGLTGVTRIGGDRSDDLLHNLNAIGKAELVEDFLFVDGTANISQQLISLLGSPADASTNSSNRATVGTYSLSPYIVKRFGTFANATVRYTASGAIFQNNVANDIASNTLSASVSSGSQFNDLSWGLDYSLRDATVQGGQDVQLEHYGASLGYGLSRHVRVFGTVGYDNNDYASVANANVSGRSWTAGLGWSPTRRTKLDGSFGESYFGRTYNFNFSHRTHYSVWTASYAEGTSDISQLLFNTRSVAAWHCAEGFFYGVGTLLPPSGATSCTLLGAAPVGSVPIGIANGIFISKTLRGGGTWSKGRNSASLNLYDVRRQYQQLVGMPEDEIRGFDLTYGYRLQVNTTLNAGLSYANTIVPAGLGTTLARNDDFYALSIGLNRRFAAKLDGALTLRHTQRDSNDANSSYDENSLTASVNMRF